MLHLNEQTLSRCRLVVRGKVFPGVEVAIGRAFMQVEDPMTNVSFSLENDEIVIKNATPPPSGSRA